MNRPKLLDLFCCRGCASTGYARAGFDVTGVDVDPSCEPWYPYAFHNADALTFLAERGHEFDAVHASPPCQASTTMSNRWRGKGSKADDWENLIPQTLDALDRLGVPYVVENVVGARADMPNAALLHGGMFGLDVARPRLFVTNWPLMVYAAAPAAASIGVYGERPDGRLLWRRQDGTEQRAASSIEEAADAMGVDWPIDWTGLREAIPPSYTEFIGGQLLEWLSLSTKSTDSAPRVMQDVPHEMWAWNCTLPNEVRPNGDGRDAYATCHACPEPTGSDVAQ